MKTPQNLNLSSLAAGLRLRAIRTALALAVWLASTFTSLAITNIWDGGGANNNWTTPANWNGNVAPVDGNTLLFPTNVFDQITTNDFSGLFVEGLLFQDDYTLRGDSVILTNRIIATAFGSIIIPPIFPTIDLNLRLAFAPVISVTANVSANLTFNGGITLSGSSVLFTGAGQHIVNGLISGGSSTLDVQKQGTGTLRLENTNTFAGDLLAQGGNTRVNGFVNNAIVSGANTFLSGTGRVGVLTVNTTGNIQPGINAPGIFTVDGNLTLGSSGSLRIDLDGTVLGTGYDQLRVGGPNVNLNSTALGLDLAAGFFPAPGTVFTIISNTSVSAISGTFAGLAEGAVTNVNGVKFQVSYVGGNGNDVTLTVQAPATRTWDGGGTTALWSNSTNWSGDTLPESGDNLVFPAATPNRTNTVDLSVYRFGSLTLNGFPYVFTNGTLPLTDGLVANNTSGTNTIASPIVLRDGQTFSNRITGVRLNLAQVINTNFSLRFDGPGDFQAELIGPGSGTIVKAGTGRLFLVGSNQFSGDTFLGGGEIVLRSNATLASSSFLLVSNATLRGSGTVPDLALRNNTARIEPGESPGLLTVNGNLLLTNGTAEFEWTGPTAGTQYDQLVVNGTVSISNCTLATVASYVPTTGQQLILISNDGADPVVGQFNGLPEGTEFFATANQAYVISYAGGDGNDVVLTKQVPHFVWDGSGAGNNWNTAGNWSPDGAPTAGSSLGFPNSFPNAKSSAINNFPAFTPFRYIVLSNEFSLGGAAIELSEGIRMVPGVNNITVSNDIRLTQSQVWPLGFSVFGGVLDLNGNTLTVSPGAANTTANFNGSLVGNGTVTATNATVTLRYNGSNTLSGVTLLRLAELSVGGIHSTGALRVLDNATFTIETTGRVQHCSVLLSNTPSSFNGGGSVNGTLFNSTLTNLNAYFYVASSGRLTNTTVLHSNSTISVDGVMIGSPLTLLAGNLEGQGYLSSVTATGGRIAPGGGPIRILRTGNLTLGAGVTVEMRIDGPVAGTTHDQLSVTGIVNLASATLNALSSEQLVVGNSYTIVNNDGADAIVGTFAGLPEGALTTVGLAQCQITYQGGDGNDVVLTTLSVGQRGVWAGLGFSADWTEGTNWAGAVLPEAGDALLFPPGAGQLTNVFNESVDRTYHSLTFGGSDYRIGSSFSFNPQKLLTFTNGIYATNVTGTNVIISRLGFLNTSVVSNTAGNTLVLSGLISNNFSVVLPLFSPAGEMIVSGLGESSASLTKRGPGRLRLQSSEATGNHVVHEGTLAGASSSDFGMRFNGVTFVYANLIVSNGATLEITGGESPFNNPVQLFGRMLVNATNATWSAAINLLALNNLIEVGAGSQLNVNGALTGSNGFTMDGTGILRFNNIKAYTGGTFVNGGQLFSEGLSTNASVTVNSGGVFSGVGPVGPLTCFNGAIAPGRLTNAGALYCDQGVNLNNFTQYRIRLFDAASGTNYDQLRVVGPVILGNAQLVVTQMLAFVPPVGSSFQIITNDSNDAVIGTFAGIPQNGFFTNGSTVFQISYTGGTGNDVVLTTHHYLTTGTTRTWSGLGADGFWTTPQNWGGNIAPAPGDLLSFPNGAARLANTNDYSTNTFFQKVEVADAYALAGNPLALRDGIAASASALIALPVISTGGSSSSSLDLSADNGAVTLTQQGPIDCNTFPVRALGAGKLLFTGPIRGLGGFTQIGTNSEFRGANTYSGTTLVAAGKLTCLNSAPGANDGSFLIATNSGVLEFLQSGSLNKHFILGTQITVSNSGTVAWGGALQFPSNTVTTLTVVTNTTLQVQLALDQNQIGQLVKQGPGVLYLDDLLIPFVAYYPALVRGGITVNQGRLLLGSTTNLNPVGYSNVVINGGTELLTVGEISGVTINDGTFKPNLGVGIGLATLFGNLTLTSAAQIPLQINGVIPGNEHDQIGVRGAVNLGGASLSVSLGITPVLGTSFVIVNNDGVDAVTGTFAGLPQDAIFPAGPVFLQISYSGGDGNDVSLTRVNPPFQISSISPQANGSMQISGTGQPGLPHVLEATTNLAPTIIWSPIRTNNADPLGLLNFIDASATNFPIRFYRVRGP